MIPSEEHKSLYIEIAKAVGPIINGKRKCEILSAIEMYFLSTISNYLSHLTKEEFESEIKGLSKRILNTSPLLFDMAQIYKANFKQD